MKRLTKSMTVILLSLASCGQPEPTSDVALRTTDSAGIIPIGGHAHLFPTDSSVRLMFNLVSSAQLAKYSENFGWGGSFPASAFRVSAINQGVMLWYCFRGGSRPDLFLALEHLEEYDPHNLPRGPIQTELTVPTAIFRVNPESLKSESDIRDYLKETGDVSGWKTLNAGEIRRYIASADSLFTLYPDIHGERYNSYMFGFFSARHEAAFDAFIASAGENGYIRYYFGYDERERPNRIRIILMAVNAKGVNQAMARVSEEGYGTMQRSWPPPPID
ncbi:MAG: hypothetical protein JNN04_10485 [Cyclobacteriaceae bacterium]|nr:hypothetical protein [Cyclobacteriaceae bacterium]